jgi:hypothetical protein
MKKEYSIDELDRIEKEIKEKVIEEVFLYLKSIKKGSLKKDKLENEFSLAEDEINNILCPKLNVPNLLKNKASDLSINSLINLNQENLTDDELKNKIREMLNGIDDIFENLSHKFIDGIFT